MGDGKMSKLFESLEWLKEMAYAADTDDDCAQPSHYREILDYITFLQTQLYVYKEPFVFVGGSEPSTCLHDNCPECHGTGVKPGGGACIHNIACCCPKCSPSY